MVHHYRLLLLSLVFILTMGNVCSFGVTNLSLITTNNLQRAHSSNRFVLEMATEKNIVADVVGVGASSVVLYSEWTLSQTGCGLPAGPYGIVGGIEGISYLLVVAIAAQTILIPSDEKKEINVGFIASLISILIGLLVLFGQLTNYGYIPNAVPMEGGMCQ